MNRIVPILVTLLITVTLCELGTFALGYLSAIAIPQSYFLWFDKHLSIQAGLMLVQLTEWLFSLGFSAAVSGWLLAKLFRERWRFYALLTFIASVFYLVLGQAWLHGFTARFPEQPTYMIDFARRFMVLGLCLFLSAYASVPRPDNPRYGAPKSQGQK